MNIYLRDSMELNPVSLLLKLINDTYFTSVILDVDLN